MLQEWFEVFEQFSLYKKKKKKLVTKHLKPLLQHYSVLSCPSALPNDKTSQDVSKFRASVCLSFTARMTNMRAVRV